ncbi:MAG: phage major capsid protein [Solirubrobacteraceae bacterium]
MPETLTHTPAVALDRMRDLHRQIESAPDGANTSELIDQFNDAERAHHLAQLNDAANRPPAGGVIPDIVAGTFTSDAAAQGSGMGKGGRLLGTALARAGFRGRFSVSEGGGLGAALTPVEFGQQFFDLLAPLSVMLASGATVIDTHMASLKLPALISDPVASWTAEGTVIAEVDPSGQYVTAIPHKLAAIVTASNEVLVDSSPAALGVIEYQLARALSLGLDQGFFQGTGVAPSIRGLKNVAGIQTLSMGTNGATLTNFDAFAQALGLLEAANARGPYAIVMHPSVWKGLLQIKELAASTKPTLDWPAGIASEVVKAIYGMPVFLTSQIAVNDVQGTANNTSSIYVYQPDQIVVVRRQPQDIVAAHGIGGDMLTASLAGDNGSVIAIDGGAFFTSDQTAIRATLRADMIVPNPAAVVRIQGVIPAP